MLQPDHGGWGRGPREVCVGVLDASGAALEQQPGLCRPVEEMEVVGLVWFCFGFCLLIDLSVGQFVFFLSVFVFFVVRFFSVRCFLSVIRIAFFVC